MLRHEIPTLDALLDAHRDALGPDFQAYRNHCYRVVNLCAELCAASSEQLEKIAIAAAFHDLGIWTDGTFDYLAPSRQRAEAHLAAIGKSEWADEVGAMIDQHHKLGRYRVAPAALIEAFRQADWCDVALGRLGFGLSAEWRRALREAFPNAGFHKRLLQLSGRRLLTHPWSPMPMLRW
ncbi:HD domain-containing protein [Solimonas terrae]|uniref:HD domain-containing protein n=1 Tax=Solimonas terrae TaxID=1396819 RepID=A0A6M2BS93_9GAMM|nr:HD domain-containing protein [Solimonas terrae]NGY04973.1 HD domain-containing protein [Solimonas terrae]